MNTLENLLKTAQDSEAGRAAYQAAMQGAREFNGASGFTTFAILGGFVLLGVVLAAVLAARAGGR